MPTVPDFDIIDLARAEERRIAVGISEISDSAPPFAGGVMARASPGSWSNAVFGAGMSGPVTVAEVDAMIDFYTASAIEPRVELCPYADLSLTRALSARGFVISNFENVLFYPLEGPPIPPSRWPPPPGLRIRRIDQADDAEVTRHATVAMLGFHPPGTVIPGPLLEVSKRCARLPRVAAVLAEIDGEVVGAGSVEHLGEISALFGATVLPHARNRGVQRAMIEWRMNFAREHGCRWATIGTRPGHITERNVRRLGFQIAYTKIILVRPAPGLAPVVE